MNTAPYKASAKVFVRMLVRLLPAALAFTLVLTLISVLAPSSPTTGGFDFSWWALPAVAVLFFAFSVTVVESILAHRENRLPGETATEVRVD